MLEREASARLAAYFARIDYDGSTTVSEETLRSIHLLQSWNIPFENVDIHLDRGVSLLTDALFEKLVGRRRGGYCYELNGLLAYVLTSLGFHVSMLAARTRLGGAMVAPKTHMLLLVEVAGRSWITDAGFGAYGLNTCVALDPSVAVRCGNESYRIVKERAPIYELQRAGAAGWLTLYDFTLVAMDPADFEVMNYFHSTNPASRFRRRVVLSRVGEFTRTLLLDLDLRKGPIDEPSSDAIADVASYRRALLDEFGIHLGRDGAEQLFESIVSRGESQWEQSARLQMSQSRQR
ncbi:MAG TPA: arylamine N-acetyltransferase [Candidatus Tumulicola sp.]